MVVLHQRRWHGRGPTPRAAQSYLRAFGSTAAQTGSRSFVGKAVHLYHLRQNPLRFRLQILLGALSGGRPLGRLAVLAASCLPGSSLHEKRIVFQQGPTVGPGGRVLHCRHCPDATVVNGKLVPICIPHGLDD